MTLSTYRVIYGDTDQMGVVYYANYLALFERGRCEYMRERAFDYGAFEREGFMLPVVEAHAKYRLPAKFDDLLLIDANITEASRITATFRYAISREDGGKRTLLCEGTTVHACLSREGRPVRWPEALKSLLPDAVHAAAGLQRQNHKVNP
jgi:acyl-CoA thioester hydrolase